MQTEIEAKFPGIDPVALRVILKQVGAHREHEERLMRRRNFDYPDHYLEKKGGWIRVRDEGDQVSLAYKQLNDRTLYGTKEVTLAVQDFDLISVFLESVGFIQVSYQETKRERWQLGTVEVTIDTWPWVPSFVELEGPTEEAVRAAAQKLKLDWAEAMHGSVETVYQMHFEITEEEINACPEILFVEVPEVWEKKRKKAGPNMRTG